MDFILMCLHTRPSPENLLNAILTPFGLHAEPNYSGLETDIVTFICGIVILGFLSMSVYATTLKQPKPGEKQNR